MLTMKIFEEMENKLLKDLEEVNVNLNTISMEHSNLKSRMDILEERQKDANNKKEEINKALKDLEEFKKWQTEPKNVKKSTNQNKNTEKTLEEDSGGRNEN